MTSRLVTTSFAIVSAAALLTGCDSISNMFDGKSSSGSSGVSHSASTGSGAPAHNAYNTSPNVYGTDGYYGSAAATDRAVGMSNAAGESVSIDKVKRAQQALKDQGAYKGPIDGVIGPQTRDAVARYQRDHNLKATAMLDDQTLRSLDSRVSATTRR
jgi:hypothetical protein